MSKYKLLIITLTALAVVSCKSVNVKKTEVKETINAPVHAETNPIALSKVIVNLDRGEQWGSIQSGWLCVPQPGGEIKYRQGRVNVTSEILNDIFRQTVEDAGYEVAGDPDNLFEDKSDIQTDYAVGGLVQDMKANICWPNAGWGNWEDNKGEAYIKVEWQIYDTLNREVVETYVTEGSYVKESTDDMPAEMIIEEAFAIAINNLLAEKSLVEMLMEDRTKNITQETESLDKTVLNSEKKTYTSFKENVTEIRSSVATVRSSKGHGSGFFISQDGYLLTNQHVVGNSKYVKVILPTGREILGDVIKVNKARDVALLRTESAGINTLPLATRSPQMGTNVYAIGSPLKEEYQNTISSGIISGYREIDGQEYLQSDVNVNPGNSGGPLINEEGNVIGITVSGATLKGVPSGINFFVPIQDALDALNISYSSI